MQEAKKPEPRANVQTRPQLSWWRRFIARLRGEKPASVPKKEDHRDNLYPLW